VSDCDSNCVLSDGLSLELSPSTDQVVFAGDALWLRCHTQSSDEQVRWYLNSRLFIANRQAGELQQTYSDAEYHPGVMSSVRLDPLRRRHSGHWTCETTTPQGHKASRSACSTLSVDLETHQLCH